MTVYSKERVKLLHQLIAQATGGEMGLRDEGLLEAALNAAFASFDGKDLYPTKVDKAARIGYDLIANHAFLDGNKRIGMYVMIAFLEGNSIAFDASADEVVATGMAVAAGKMDFAALRTWLYEHVAGVDSKP